MLPVIKNHISGQSSTSTSLRQCDVRNPATGEVIAKAPLSTEGEVKLAIDAAWNALPAWRGMPPAKRAQILFDYRDLLKSHIDELAPMLSEQHGKTLPHAKGEIARGIEVVEFACGIPHLLKGEYSEAVASGVDSFSIRQPVGVCAGITPFNFPAMVPLWM